MFGGNAPSLPKAEAKTPNDSRLLKDALQRIWIALLQKSTAKGVKDFHK